MAATLATQWLRWLFIGACASLAFGSATAQQNATHVTLKVDPATVDAYYYPVKTEGDAKAPVILALHGCGGMLDSQGKPNGRVRSYVRLLRTAGWHVLFVDSLTGRGFTSVCGQSGSTVSPLDRVVDVQAAIAWLTQQPGVDAQRMGILGWSHGGSLAVLSADKGVVYAAEPRAVLAFYPGCGALTIAANWEPARPLQLLLGSADDWTAPALCQSLARRFPEQVQQHTYEGAGHGFDGDTPVRAMVIGAGTRRGEYTVHVGRHEPSAEASRQRVLAFFQEHFQK